MWWFLTIQLCCDSGGQHSESGGATGSVATLSFVQGRRGRAVPAHVAQAQRKAQAAKKRLAAVTVRTNDLRAIVKRMPRNPHAKRALTQAEQAAVVAWQVMEWRNGNADR